jgi:hypothetical protein
MSSQKILNPYRQALVDFLFLLLDQNGSGFIEAAELTEYIERVPSVGIFSGRNISADQKAYEFIRIIGNETKAHISLSQLSKYYAEKAAMINDDLNFKYDMMDEWKFDEEIADMYISQVAPNFPQDDLPQRGIKKKKSTGGENRTRRGSSGANISPRDESPSSGSSGPMMGYDASGVGAGAAPVAVQPVSPFPGEKRAVGKTPRVTTASASPRARPSPTPWVQTADDFNAAVEERRKVYEDF